MSAIVFEKVSYDPATGVFTWIANSTRAKAGTVAGGKTSRGYIHIQINGKKYHAHRLAWYLVHGKHPENSIDHINGNPSDNRICNLRDVPHRVNLQNLRGPKRQNQSGFLGVRIDKAKKRWKAEIYVNNVRHRLGCFKTPEAASLAYLDAKRRLHAGCTI